MSVNRCFSVIIPAYNEAETIENVVARVLQQPCVGEIVIVDDFSGDETLKIARRIAEEEPKVRVFWHDLNQGKGAALRTGIQKATKDFVIVQDADLEYDPKELNLLIVPLLENKADVVFGSRFAKRDSRMVLRFWHSMGNLFLTMLSNMASDLHLTDMETCYKAFRREIIQSIPIEENRFGFEPEITAKVAKLRKRIVEMSISYHPRSYDEGKKIGWRDGVRAIYCIIKYNFFGKPAAPPQEDFAFQPSSEKES